MKTFQSERDVKKEVKKLLTAHRYFWWMPPAHAFGKSNVDFNALRTGVFMAIETKFGRNRPTPLQIGYLNSVRAEDGFAFVVNEKSIEYLAQWLSAFDRAAMAAGKQQEVDPVDGSIMLNAIHVMTELL